MPCLSCWRSKATSRIPYMRGLNVEFARIISFMLGGASFNLQLSGFILHPSLVSSIILTASARIKTRAPFVVSKTTMLANW